MWTPRRPLGHPQRPAVAGRVVDFGARLALLGGEHGQVGAPEQLVRVAAGQLADPDAYRQRHESRADGGWVGERSGEGAGQLPRGAGGDEDELVAAEAGDQVTVGGGLLEAVAGFGEVVVAGGVTAGSVVDVVQAVDVGHRDGEQHRRAGGDDRILGDPAHR